MTVIHSSGCISFTVQYVLSNSHHVRLCDDALTWHRDFHTADRTSAGVCNNPVNEQNGSKNEKSQALKCHCARCRMSNRRLWSSIQHSVTCRIHLIKPRPSWSEHILLQCFPNLVWFPFLPVLPAAVYRSQDCSASQKLEQRAGVPRGPGMGTLV